MGRFTGLLGLVVILSLAWLLSTNRKAIRWQTAGWGLALQWIFAVLVLRFDAGERALAAAGDAVNRMLAYAFVGSGFVFGELGKQHSSFGLIIAFQVLPTIIFISAFFAVLYHLGIMQIVIKAAARLMQCDHGHQRRRVAERGRQHLHGPDRGSAQHSSVPARSDAVGTDDHHDQRDGARLRRHHGGLYPLRD